MENFRDILRTDGIKKMGYGIVPKMVALDRKLTIEALTIYSYFCSYAGAGDTAFPSVRKICQDLKIGRERYYNHFNLLTNFGYVGVEQIKNEKGRFRHNIYTLIEKPVAVGIIDDTDNQTNDFRDILRVEGVRKMGYGIIPKMVMLDDKITIEAKGIYSYFCSYAGAGNTAFPPVGKICMDLGVGEDRYYKHLRFLIDLGYIKIKQMRTQKGKLAHNIYTLIENPTPVDKLKSKKDENNKFSGQKYNRSGENIENKPSRPYPQNQYTVKQHTENQDTIINTPSYNYHSSYNYVCPTKNGSATIETNRAVDNFADRQTETKQQTENNQQTQSEKLKNILNNSGLKDIRNGNGTQPTFSLYADALEQAIKLLFFNRKGQKLKDSYIPYYVIQEDINKINQFVLECAISKFEEASRQKKIKNTVAYLATCILDSVYSMNLDVRSDQLHNNIV